MHKLDFVARKPMLDNGFCIVSLSTNIYIYFIYHIVLLYFYKDLSLGKSGDRVTNIKNKKILRFYVFGEMLKELTEYDDSGNPSSTPCSDCRVATKIHCSIKSAGFFSFFELHLKT